MPEGTPSLLAGRQSIWVLVRRERRKRIRRSITRRSTASHPPQILSVKLTDCRSAASARQRVSVAKQTSREEFFPSRPRFGEESQPEAPRTSALPFPFVGEDIKKSLLQLVNNPPRPIRCPFSPRRPLPSLAACHPQSSGFPSKDRPQCFEPSANGLCHRSGPPCNRRFYFSRPT